VPDLSHLYQRFLLGISLLMGLAIGIAVTVFGYSNLATVDVHWSVFHIDNVPLWTVTVVPLTLILIAGTIYHWLDGLHHFTEHMRHRHRVHELEAEVGSLRRHLDQVLEMPDQSALAGKPSVVASLPPADEGITDLGPLEEVRPATPAAELAKAQSSRSDRKASERPKRATLTGATSASTPGDEADKSEEVDLEATPKLGA